MKRIVESLRNSLAIKTAVFGFLIASVFITLLLAVNYNFVSHQMMEAYRLKAKTIGRYLDSSIQNYEDFRDRNGIFTKIQKSIWLDTDLLNVSLYRAEGGNAIGVISSQGVIEGNIGDAHNLQAFKENRIITQELYSEDGDLIRVFAPVHIARQQVGSFQFDITLENLYRVQAKLFQTMIIANLLLILLFIGILLLYLRRHVIKPLYLVSDAARKIARGDLDTRVLIQGTDEFGQLGQDFNNMAQNLARQHDQLRKSHKMDAVGQLTGGIAHDFNNILGIIIGNLGLLKYVVSDNDEATKRVVTIEEVTQRAAELVRQLLGFSRLQATDVVVININRLILKMDTLINLSTTPEVKVELQLADNLGSTGINLGDFQDSLLNMILNARDAMPNGGRLRIETSNCTLDAANCSLNPNLVVGEYVKLSVSDTGSGISSEQQDKIYEPFYTTKEVGKGSGLGLSMVFGFITRSKGHIEIESKPGSGTTFHLYLPRVAEPAIKGSTVKQKTEALPRGSETILAVDDEKELLDLAKESLETLGYSVLTAENGREALKRLAEHSDISLLFSDVVMPGGMSGYELAEQAMVKRSNLKILMTSGHPEKVDSQAQQRYNLIMKPYTSDDLIRRVQSLLDGPISEPS